MKNRKSNQWLAAACMTALAIGNIYVSTPAYEALGNMANASNGAMVDLSGMDADTYHVTGVWEKKDGSYVVEASAEGFQSTITVKAHLDAAASQILDLEIVNQGDTDGIGSKITGEPFLSQFAGAAVPVQVKDMEVISPKTGLVYGAAEQAPEEEAKEAVNLDPAAWNPADVSPESQTMRKMYEAGLLDTAYRQEPLKTAVADGTVEERAMERMHEAGLLGSAYDGKPLATPLADMTAEEQSIVRMQEGGLLEGAGEAEAAAADVTAAAGAVNKIDGIAGATVSSSGAAKAVDYAFFFMKEQVLK